MLSQFYCIPATNGTNSVKEKIPFKREETLSRTWIIRGDLPAEDKLGIQRKEDGGQRRMRTIKTKMYGNIISDKIY